MKAFVATVFSAIAGANAQLVYNNLGAYAPAPIAAPYAAAVPAAIPAAIPAAASSQFHAQDELGQFQFGYAGPLSSKQEARNAYGVTTGSYSQIDANGQLQVTNYVSDPINGFRVASSNLPVAPAAPVVAPLEAPVFKAVELEAPVMTLEQVDDTEEVKEAKAAFFKAFDEAKNREKRQAILPASTAPLAVPALAAPVAAAPAFSYAAAPAFNAAYATAYAAAPAPLPVATYAAAPAPITTVAAPAPVPVATYAAAPAIAPVAPVAATYATAGPAAGAIPSVKTTIKLNPGHSTFYRVDPVA